MAKENRNLSRSKESDYITNKVLAVFSVCLFGVLFLMFLYKMLDSANKVMTGYYINIGLGIFGAVCLIIGITKYVRDKTNKLDTRYSIVTGKSLMIFSVVAILCSLFIMYYYLSAIKILYIVIPAIAVFYLVYFAYQREFFVVTIDLGVAAALLWVIGKAQANTDRTELAYISVVIYAVFFILQLIILLKAKKNNGKIKIGKELEELFSTQTGLLMMIITPIVMIIVLCAAFLIGSTASYYLMFAIFAYLFVSAVYYTVKLI